MSDALLRGMCTTTGSCALLLLLLSLGCSRPPAAVPPPSSQPRFLSPIETVQRLIEFREEGRAEPMRALIVPERVDAVLETLAGVDDFVAANRELIGFLREHVSVALATAVDQSRLLHNLDIFSPYVEIIDETLRGDVAEVSFLVDGELPLRRARLVRSEGVWRYDPGEEYHPDIPLAFHKMAGGMRELLAELRTESMLPATFAEDPQQLLMELGRRMAAGARMLPQPASRPARRLPGD